MADTIGWLRAKTRQADREIVSAHCVGGGYSLGRDEHKAALGHLVDALLRQILTAKHDERLEDVSS